MAITIVDQPTAFAKVGQKLMIVATSTNVAQPNFRYVVRVENPTRNITMPDVLVPPNPQNRLMVDISNLVKEWVAVSVVNTIDNTNHMTEDALIVYDYLYNNLTRVHIHIYEGYDVAGVFTIDELTETSIEDQMIMNAKYSIRDGYKPDPNLIYSFNSTTSLLLGGRNTSTHIPKDNTYLTANSQRVFIPVRRNELDWGAIQFITSDSLANLSGNTIDPAIRMTLYESDGTPNTTTFYPLSYADSFEAMFSMTVYPANLNAHGELLRPADFPNWRWYEIAMYDSTNTTRKSAIYTFYPVDVDCLHDNVRLGWWDAENGGFDFFNFTKKNEQTVEVERTRVQKVVGSYNATTFTFDPSDHELAEGDIAVRTYIDINSDYIQEGEFALLKRLITSPLVYIVEDSGVNIPVLVETNSYTSKKTRDGKLYNVSIRLRYSNELM